MLGCEEEEVDGGDFADEGEEDSPFDAIFVLEGECLGWDDEEGESLVKVVEEVGVDVCAGEGEEEGEEDEVVA